MSQELVAQLARRFIQRRDIKAVQFSSGAYVPDTSLKNRNTNEPDPGRFGPLGFMSKHLEDHLAGNATYGHYLLDTNDQCRLFAFDIDLEQNKTAPDGTVSWGGSYIDLWQYELHQTPELTEEEWKKLTAPTYCNPREVWADRSNLVARRWYKYQMSLLARKFCAVITKELNLPCAAAYSGSKGVHVYGFTGPMPAEEVREAAMLALDITDEWEPLRGKNFFKHKIQDPEAGFPSFSVEVFPKQTTLDGKDLGNLMRLPLGRNLKSPDPTFFLDLTGPVVELRPHANPVALLESGNPYL